MDSFKSQIWIGGKIREDNIPGLVEALYEDEAADDFGGETIAKDCTEEQLLAYLDNESLLNFCCEEAETGEFKATEYFCQSHDISFNRTSDRYAEYDGEDYYWRPGMEAPVITFFDDSGSEIVRGFSVRKAIELLEKFADKLIKTGDVVTPKISLHFGEALRCLQEVCPKIPEKLEPFEKTFTHKRA